MSATASRIELSVEQGTSGRTLDVLSGFPDDFAREMFLDLWLPVLGYAPDSAEGVLLWRVLNPAYRDTFSGTSAQITSTPELVRHLHTMVHTDEAAALGHKLTYCASNFHVTARHTPA